MSLIVENLSKSFNNQPVIKNYHLTIDENEIVALVGRSGTGKTTFLRLINNLELADQGTIQMNDDSLVKDGAYVGKVGQRNYQNRMGMVFQNYELFPNLSVLENLLEAPLAQKLGSKEELKDRAMELLNSMEIVDKIDAMPSTLSGGQAQRVAIARAMMLSPDILCFDEPTSALDEESAKNIGKLIQTIAQQGTGILIVTHDNTFAKKYSTRIIASEDFL
ncbi:polar amino acid transport system ATP-binding protein [Atopostipes suicloacalis DSM 15692]|uniref:Polar amino acid transport system ATP-binding protein n=1 Tax=Atopostipes suicloacalis DSM 15692 TaxID=1121025 RepID=A0A1M4V1B2_9LACT|nr:ATP-binding cassette domain-containing protein [Atopostipes suicloacalis]SHE62682.1 polar amino acid transport system ATP-binding protein [Atopostipes suicloacalis DSM 15692]